MNNNACLLLVSSLLITACGQSSTSATWAGPANPEDCPTGSVITNRITIPAASIAIDTAPPHICVIRGTEIAVTVAGNQKRGSVGTTPKAKENTWLSGSNSANKRKFVLYVNDAVKNGDYDFNVTRQNGDTKDPRVTVVDD